MLHTVVFSPLHSQHGRGYAMHLELLSDDLHIVPEFRASLRLHTAGWQSSWLARDTALWLLSKCVLCPRNSDGMCTACATQYRHVIQDDLAQRPAIIMHRA